MKQNYKKLATDVGVLAISSFSTKLLSFLLVPLYTAVLSTSDYGTYDIVVTTISLLLPIVTLDITDAVVRFTLDEKCNNADVFSCALKVTVVGLSVVSIIILGLHCLFDIEIVDNWGLFFVLMATANAIQGILSNFVRGLNRVKSIAISGLIGTATMLTLNILFLLYLKIGLTGYFMANILSTTIQIIYLACVVDIKKYVKFKANNSAVQKAMIHYSLPMVVSGVSWWINSASDRYFVSALCGLNENGIYAVGSKIPQILNVVQSIFSQAWILSAVGNFDKKDSNGFFSKMYNLYMAVLVMGCSLIITFDKLLASTLYAKNFYSAWKYVPFLTIAVVFGAISGYTDGIFEAVKDTRSPAKVTAIGAFINIILNFILILKFNALGAAVATAVSYFSVWILRMKSLKKHISLNTNPKRDMIAIVVITIQSVFLLFENVDIQIQYTVQALLTVTIFALYRSNIIPIIDAIVRNAKKCSH